jgi:arginine exporter protein ArgO
MEPSFIKEGESAHMILYICALCDMCLFIVGAIVIFFSHEVIFAIPH